MPTVRVTSCEMQYLGRRAGDDNYFPRVDAYQLDYDRMDPLVREIGIGMARLLWLAPAKEVFPEWFGADGKPLPGPFRYPCETYGLRLGEASPMVTLVPAFPEEHTGDDAGNTDPEEDAQPTEEEKKDAVPEALVYEALAEAEKDEWLQEMLAEMDCGSDADDEEEDDIEPGSGGERDDEGFLQRHGIGRLVEEPNLLRYWMYGKDGPPSSLFGPPEVNQASDRNLLSSMLGFYFDTSQEDGHHTQERSDWKLDVWEWLYTYAKKLEETEAEPLDWSDIKGVTWRASHVRRAGFDALDLVYERYDGQRGSIRMTKAQWFGEDMMGKHRLKTCIHFSVPIDIGGGERITLDDVEYVAVDRGEGRIKRYTPYVSPELSERLDKYAEIWARNAKCVSVCSSDTSDVGTGSTGLTTPAEISDDSDSGAETWDAAAAVFDGQMIDRGEPVEPEGDDDWLHEIREEQELRMEERSVLEAKLPEVSAEKLAEMYTAVMEVLLDRMDASDDEYSGEFRQRVSSALMSVIQGKGNADSYRLFVCDRARDEFARVMAGPRTFDLYDWTLFIDNLVHINITTILGACKGNDHYCQRDPEWFELRELGAD